MLADDPPPHAEGSARKKIPTNAPNALKANFGLTLNFSVCMGENFTGMADIQSSSKVHKVFANFVMKSKALIPLRLIDKPVAYLFNPSASNTRIAP